MPPYLAMPYFHLSKLPLTTKTLLTGFYISLAAGIVFVGIAYFPQVLKPNKDSARDLRKKEIGTFEAYQEHFDPREATRESMKDAPKEIIDDAVKNNVEGQRGQAYAIIHPHSFLMPVVFFILGHLLEMTTVWRSVKIVLYGVSVVSMILTVFAPILVLSWPGLAPIAFCGLYVMLGSFLAMIALPCAHMWIIKG